MFKFIKKVILLFSICFSIFLTYYFCLSLKQSNTTGLAEEVFYVLEKAQTTSSHTTVYLGDSVSNQLWSQKTNSEDACHLSSNQAITQIGSYILLKEYLENNPQTEKVYYIVQPKTLANDLWTNYTYQYFIIPFCDKDTFSELEPQIQDKLHNKFGKIFISSNLLKYTLLNNNLLMQSYLNQIDTADENHDLLKISEVTAIYLQKMIDLCREKNVELILKSSPLSNIPENHNLYLFSQNIIDYGFEDFFDDYIETIDYYPLDWFSDGSHFTKSVLKEHGETIREAVLN